MNANTAGIVLSVAILLFLILTQRSPPRMSDTEKRLRTARLFDKAMRDQEKRK